MRRLAILTSTSLPFLTTLFLAGSFLPAHAQDTTLDAQLRNELRAVLLADPRAASLSESELDSMLTALVQEAEEQGVIQDYVLPSTPVVFSVDEAEENVMVPWGGSFDATTLYFVILLCLAFALLLLWLLLHMHKKKLPVS